jgi:hypothetical protein
MFNNLTEKLVKQIETLPGDLQLRVMEYVQSLSSKSYRRRGVPGSNLLKFSGVIPKKDLNTMKKAIEEGCERVDGEW